MACNILSKGDRLWKACKPQQHKKHDVFSGPRASCFIQATTAPNNTLHALHTCTTAVGQVSAERATYEDLCCSLVTQALWYQDLQKGVNSKNMLRIDENEQAWSAETDRA